MEVYIKLILVFLRCSFKILSLTFVLPIP